MNYKKALELKEAGFPQDKNGCVISPEGHIGNNFDTDEHCLVPTLDEVIEELGDKFVSLENTKDGWCAVGGEVKKLEYPLGKTPLEAVSNLYIKLNKK